MRYTKIDLDAYPRRAHFEYFRGLGYPYVGATVNLDATRFLQRTKAAGRPFFLSFLYEAANAVEALRQRIVEDGIAQFAFCPTSHTVMRPDGTFVYCRLEANMPREEFLAYAATQQKAALAGGDIEDGEDALSYLFVSTVPWFSYTALVQAVPTGADADSNPRITWGRYFEQAGRTLIPVSLLAHHALVDGLHIGQFYQNLSERLDACG